MSMNAGNAGAKKYPSKKPHYASAIYEKPKLAPAPKKIINSQSFSSLMASGSLQTLIANGNISNFWTPENLF